MRIVEYQKDTSNLNYRLLKGLGVCSGIFSLIVAVLMIANTVGTKRADPIHFPALLEAKEALNSDRNNEALREEIRDLDLLTRKQFFTSQRFNRIAVFMLFGGLIVMVSSFKALETYKAKYFYPDGSDPKDDLIENAAWARKSVTAAGLVMVGFALILALPWKSKLSDEETSAATEGGSGEPPPTGGAASPGIVSEPGASAPEVKPAPEPEPEPSEPVVVASREEMLQNWPNLRGPNGGVVTMGKAPTKWSGESGEGVVWKAKVPLTGFSSPIIWKDKIFLSGGDRETRQVYCYSVEKGELIWTHDVKDIPGSPAEAPKVSADTGYAAASMITDGTRVFAIFSTGDIVALDMAGAKVWGRNLGVPENPYGHSSSLELHEDILLVQYDQEEHSFVAGLHVGTGKDRWRVERKFGPSWASPLLHRGEGGSELILAADPMVTSYDPATGKELWSVECLKGGEVAPSPVYADGVFFVACDYVCVAAIDAQSHELLWKGEDLIPGVSTPMVTKGLMFGGLADGSMFCLDAKSGEEKWFEDTDDGFYASPLLINGNIYLIDRMGKTHIFEAAGEFKSVGQPELGEEAVCTPAVSGDSLFIRGVEHLYRIGS